MPLKEGESSHRIEAAIGLMAGKLQIQACTFMFCLCGQIAHKKTAR